MRKMKFLAWLLVVLIVSTMLPVTAMAEFEATKTWSDELFTDVAENDWFYENVESAYELGLMVGVGEKEFDPAGKITLAQAVTVAARIHAIAATGEERFEQGNPWYRVYADYALENGILAGELEDYNRQATRLEFAQILSKALSEEDLKAINTVDDGMIPDVAEDEAVYLLYRAGILIGSEADGTFYPDSDIKRSEVAAIVTRMALPELRKEITLTAEEAQKKPTGSQGNIVIRPGDEVVDPEEPEISNEVEVTAPVETENGAVKTEVSLESETVKATVPAGVALEEDAQALILTMASMKTTGSDVTAGENETMSSYDIKIEGVAADNTVPMTITLPGLLKKGLNTTSVEMYHVENGVTVPMTLVADPVNHNEFSYDPATGDVVICTATFSEYVAVTDNKNLWKGQFDYSWYIDKTSPYTISSADQLAAFGQIVDGTADGIAADDFAGDTVQLGADIDLSGGYSLNPIGCGYVNGVANSNGVIGRAFSGTFDGQNHTISGLYQNGWDLGLSYCTLGGGLFASIANGTVKNLTISGADIAMECVEMGVLVGLSQGNCTYDNIKIYASKIANYQRATGGLIGEVSPYGASLKTEITNVTIGSDVVVGSLWGDFDAPVGGVIGAYWDANCTEDNYSPKVEMTNVTVAARLDVYNDVTSSYQWYAYRRAGMLIGNTDMPAADGKNGKTATAPFLTCDNVTVKYGDWVNYHYCEFNNHNSSWPWVRVEAGENCAAYSNPRYGVPNDVDGKKVVDADHKHQDGDTCMELIAFNQLYGGGQGVYGQPAHVGVTVERYVYSIQYINDGKVLAETYVKSNTSPHILTEDSNCAAAENEAKKWIQSQGYTVEFGGWVNAGSTKVTLIPEGNTENIKLYSSFKERFTVTYVDNEGIILHREVISAGQETTKVTPAVPAIAGGYTGVWSMTDFSGISSDVTVYPVYNAEDGIVKLTPVDSEPKDGVVDYYQVTNVEENDKYINIVIPDSFNGKPVTEITGNAFAEFDNITTVKIPTSITTIGADAFANKENSGFLGALKYEQITFLYEGTYEQWQAIEKDENWDRYVGQGSRIYFLADGNYIEETARNGTWSAADRVWSEPAKGTYPA